MVVIKCFFQSPKSQKLGACQQQPKLTRKAAGSFKVRPHHRALTFTCANFNCSPTTKHRTSQHRLAQTYPHPLPSTMPQFRMGSTVDRLDRPSSYAMSKVRRPRNKQQHHICSWIIYNSARHAPSTTRGRHMATGFPSICAESGPVSTSCATCCPDINYISSHQMPTRRRKEEAGLGA